MCYLRSCRATSLCKVGSPTGTFHDLLNLIPARAVRLGKKGTRPRLLMVQTGNKQEKAAIMRNCTKLRNENNPDKIREVFITPDLTPKERENDKALRAELSKRKTASGNSRYMIKKREDSAEGTHLRPPPPSTQTGSRTM